MAGNRGLILGDKPNGMEVYIPKLDTWPGGTPPTLGQAQNGATQWGEYFFDESTGMVDCSFQLGWALGGNTGGAGAYLVSLPIPCRSQYDSVWAITNDTGAPGGGDKPIGYGKISQGFDEAPNMAFSLMPGDYAGAAYGGRKREWAQMWCPYIRLSGSAAITAATSVNVTWPGGITLNTAPNASDILIMPTTAMATLRQLYISAISTTGFTLTASSSTTVSFSWKCISDTSLLIGANAPWNVGGAFDNIFACLRYPADI